jgi:hypothetical protein
VKAKIPAPVLGVTDAVPFVEQPGRLTDPNGLLNAVPVNVGNDRGQLATRPKLESEYDGARNRGPVAAIGEIARASGVTGIRVTKTIAGTAGSNRSAGAIRGQCAVLDTDRSLLGFFDDDRGTYTDGTALADPPTDTGGFGAFEVCWHSTDPDVGYFATIAADIAASDSNGGTAGGTSGIIVGLNRFSLATMTVTHQAYAVDEQAPATLPVAGQTALLANKIVQFGPYLFVGVGRYVYAFRASDLTYIRRHLIDWAEEVQCIQTVTVRGVRYLLALATGSYTVAGAVADDAGPSPVERYGEFARCNISLWEFRYQGNDGESPVNPGHSALNRKRMPQGTRTGDTYHEDHGTFRFSDWSTARPRGCLAYSMAVEVDADHNVYAYVVRTNQGFGYDGAVSGHGPDGPFITVCRCVLTRAFEPGAPTYISPSTPVRYGLSESVGGWERDTPNSLRRIFQWHGADWANDIPAIVTGLRDPEDDTNGNEPSLKAVAIDAVRRRLFVAGRGLGGASGENVFCLDMDNGDLLWGADVGGKVQQNAIAVDATTGNLFVPMRRNQNWTMPDGSSSHLIKAEMLELAGATGQTVDWFDLTDTITFNGAITSGNADTRQVGGWGCAVNGRGQVLIALAPYRMYVP